MHLMRHNFEFVNLVVSIQNDQYVHVTGSNYFPTRDLSAKAFLMGS